MNGESNIYWYGEGLNYVPPKDMLTLFGNKSFEDLIS